MITKGPLGITQLFSPWFDTEHDPAGDRNPSPLEQQDVADILPPHFGTTPSPAPHCPCSGQIPCQRPRANAPMPALWFLGARWLICAVALRSSSGSESQLTTLFIIVLGGELQPSIKCVVKEIALHSVTVREMLPFNL